MTMQSTELHRVLRLSIAVLGLLTISGCAPTPIDSCQPSNGIHVICNLTKPEDLAHLPGTPWLLVSELGDSNTPGQVVAMNPADDVLIRLGASDPEVTEPDGFPICGPPPKSIRPRGFHLSNQAGEPPQLLLVNVGEVIRIERYIVATSGEQPRLLWTGCVSVPSHLNPNDVAALQGKGFVISHMYTPPMTLGLRTRMFLGLDTGYVARWLPDDGWQKVSGTDVSFPNGIETDPESDRIFVAATYGEQLTAINLDGSHKQTTQLPIQPDNLTWSADHQLIAVGHTGVAILGTNGCRDMVEKSCAFPFAVTAIDPNSMAVKVIHTHDKGLIPGPSVALWHEDFLFLGTFFGDRISRVVVTKAE